MMFVNASATATVTRTRIVSLEVGSASTIKAATNETDDIALVSAINGV